jgi:hypothetical protein
MGRSGTHKDLAMVKQEQGETLRKYMRRFFNKHATIVDVTDKEVIGNKKSNLDHLFPGNGARKRGLLTVNNCIKVRS